MKSFFNKLWNKIPVSISQLNYRDHDLFIGIMAFLIGFLTGHHYYYSAFFFAMVYVFRFFHMKNQRIWHYGFASLAFASVAWFSGVYWPIVLGAFGYGLFKRTGKHVFFFEMAAGIPYLFLI